MRLKSILTIIAISTTSSLAFAESTGEQKDTVLKRVAASAFSKYLNTASYYQGRFVFTNVEFPANGVIYSNEEDMMTKYDVSTPGVVGRRLVKFTVTSTEQNSLVGGAMSKNATGNALCDTEFRRDKYAIDNNQIWVFVYSCEYDSRNLKSDFEKHQLVSSPIFVQDLVDLTADELKILE